MTKRLGSVPSPGLRPPSPGGRGPLSKLCQQEGHRLTYYEKLLDYFQNPRCVGELSDADAVAQVSNPVCGDVMKLWIRVNDGRIQDAKFKAQGCSAAIATSSYATEMLIGMN